MTLAALIAAYHDADEPEGSLRATLPLAGRTLVERQARLAAAAGADPIVILVERVPAELTAAIDRMRAEGISAAVARSAMEAAEAIHPDDRLLLMADGLIADESHVARLTSAGGAALLTMPDQFGDERYERIDADFLWAGLALIEGDLLKTTAPQLGEWDLQSTLLRKAVQSGARQFAVRGEESDDGLVMAERLADLAEAEALIVENASASRGSWISRYILAPAEQALTRLLMPSSITPGWLYVAAAVLVGLSSLLFARNWLLSGLILFLLSTPLDGASDRLALLRMQRSGAPDWWAYTLPLIAGLALAALGYALAPIRGWGCFVLVTTIFAFMIALYGETEGQEVRGHHWLAEPKGMAWVLLPFALAGSWVTGLCVLAAYAGGSFFWAQRQIHRRLSPATAVPRQD